MGRHETFENAAPIDEDLLTSANDYAGSASKPDPIFAVLKDSRRLMPAVRRARRLPNIGLNRPPEQNAADFALWGHFDGILLETAPTTPVGATALAKHVLAFDRFQGLVLGEERLKRALTLIARAPAT